MKKNVWLLGAVVATLASCTQNEVLEVPESKQIRFEEFVEKNSRVADDLYDVKTALLTDYWVYGYNTASVSGSGTQASPYVGDFSSATPVFENMHMTKAGETWSGEETDYWKTDNMYRFAAYSNGNKEISGVTYSPATDVLTIPNYSVIDATQIVADNPETTGVDETVKPLDLLASIAGDRHASTGAQPVAFTFRHLLAKVTFHFTNASTNADVAFNNVTVTPIAKQGTCVCQYPNGSSVFPFPKNVTWNSLGATSDFNFGSVNVPKVASGTSSDEVTFYVIPQSNENAKVNLTLVESIGSGTYNSENLSFNLVTNTHFSTDPADVATNKWVAGYHYRYLITKGTTFGDIQFSATVDTWNKDRNGDNNPGENADDVTPTPVTP